MFNKDFDKYFVVDTNILLEDFTNIVDESNDDTINLNSWTSGSLETDKQYYVCVCKKM